MNKPPIMILPLSEVEPAQEADMFALLVELELLHTKDGRPFYKAVFRDAKKELPTVPIWFDTDLFKQCQNHLKVGEFYKLRALLRSTVQYGQQLEIHIIRPVSEGDKQDGFDPVLCRPGSQFSGESMYDEILALAKTHLGKGSLLILITKIFKENRQALLNCAASRVHHHNFVGGLLEHTLNVLKTAIFLADHHIASYPNLPVPFSKPLVVAGAILHDIGKIRELRTDSVSSHYTLEGELIGHSLLSRDILRQYASAAELEPNVCLHLEHILISHLRFPDWGAPKPPMSLEAVLVHTADSCDALFGSFVNIMQQDETKGEVTSSKNRLSHAILRGTPKPKEKANPKRSPKM